MAKVETKYLISYKSLLETFQKGSIPNNILISLKEKVLLDELISIICSSFGGKNFNSKDNLISFNAEDKQMDNVLNECSNIGLFSEKKVVVLRNVKKLLKDAKLSLLDYLKRPNPDSCLIMISSDEEFAPEKIFLFDPKAVTDSSAENKRTTEKNVKIFQISEFSESELIKWTGEKFEGYKISSETLKHFVHFSNNSFDEILSEIEKLKTYCWFTKEITNDSVNMCNGISKDFNEIDFIIAITERKMGDALKIYDHISLKKDSEVFLVFLMNTAFITINKLFDPNTSKLDGFMLKKELKLWFPDQEKLIPYYKEFRKTFSHDKMSSAFEYIYSTDKLLKTSGGDKRTMMTTLIKNICCL